MRPLDQRIRVITLLHGAVAADGNSVAGALGKMKRGILLTRIISKANNDNVVVLKVYADPSPSTGYVQVGTTITIIAGAAGGKLAPMAITTLPWNGTIRVTSSGIGGTGPSIVVDMVLLGFMGTLDTFAHAYTDALGFDVNGIA